MEIRSIRVGRRLAGAGFGALISACSTLAPHDIPLPAGAVQVVAPVIYQEWQERTEACSGLTGNFSAIQWYVVPGVETFSTDQGLKVGQWIREGGQNKIVIAGNYQNHEMVVRHEILHSLLEREGHPPEYFVTRCHLTWDSWDRATGAPISGD